MRHPHRCSGRSFKVILTFAGRNFTEYPMVLIWSRIYAIWLIAISMIMILSCETFSLQHRMISAANCRLTGHVDRCRKETLTSSMRWWSQGGKVLLGPFYKAHVETSLGSISASNSRYCLAKNVLDPHPKSSPFSLRPTPRCFLSGQSCSQVL